VADKKSEKVGTDAAPSRKNARGKATREQILDNAVRFFAEVGFDGQTRELAKRTGITHAALYRHFANKEALIDAVYQRVYLDRWNPEWGALIMDRDRPLTERLQTFYVQYAERVFDYEWVRILMYSGLRETGLPNRYLVIIRERVITPVLNELGEMGALNDEPGLRRRNEELLWALHGGIIYIAIRRFVYQFGDAFDPEPAIREIVLTYLRGLTSREGMAASRQRGS